MSINNAYRYSKTIVLGDKLLHDTKNRYMFVKQSEYKGNPDKGLAPGVNLELQVLEDISEPIIDKNTGLEKDNNVLENFSVQIVGAKYPLPLKKGDYISLEDFMEEASFLFGFDLILRFKGYKKLQPVNSQGASNVISRQTK